MSQQYTVVDPLFESSGFEEGLEVWRVENLELEEWPVDSFGDFFVGEKPAAAQNGPPAEPALIELAPSDNADV